MHCFMSLAVILQENLWIIPEDHPIITGVILILFTTHYSKNYSGIMYVCLPVALAIIELRLSESISQSVSHSVSRKIC